MSEGIIIGIIKVFKKEILCIGRKLFGSTWNKIKTKKDISTYLINQKNEITHIKTLLHRKKPVYFYKIYYPLKLKSNGDVLETNNVNKLFENSNFIIIIGCAGSGKSTLLKHLFLNSIAQKERTPLYVALRDLNRSYGSFEDNIVEKVFGKNFADRKKIIQKKLSNGEFILFIDGYDEIVPSKKEKIIGEINSFANRYCKNYFVITSRPFAGIELLPLFHIYEISDLKKEDVFAFIKKQEDEKEVAEKIISSIQKNKHDYVNSYISSPFYLSLYILAFKLYSTLPPKRYLFYRRVCTALFSEHDQLTKLGFARKRCSGLTQEHIEHVLRCFCFSSYVEGRYNFEMDYLLKKIEQIKKDIPFDFSTQDFIDDLKVGVSLLVEEGENVSFAHRSLQEYFAALYVERLSSNKSIKFYEDLKTLHKDPEEAFNFLSLCEEMDSFSLYSFCLIPYLEELICHIDLSSDKTLISSFLKKWYSKIEYYEDLIFLRTFRTMITMNILVIKEHKIWCLLYNLIYDIQKKDSKFASYFYDNAIESQWGSSMLVINTADISDELINIFQDTGLTKAIKSFLKDIEENLLKAKTYIRKATEKVHNGSTHEIKACFIQKDNPLLFFGDPYGNRTRVTRVAERPKAYST